MKGLPGQLYSVGRGGGGIVQLCVVEALTSQAAISEQSGWENQYK